MRVVVTGAGGFAGPVVVEALAAAGHAVTGLVRAEPPARLTALGTQVERGDLLVPGVVAEIVARRRPEAIVHLAGLASGAAAEADPPRAYRSNVETLLAVLAAMRTGAPHARLLLISSSEVYGQVTPADLPVTEDVPPRPVSVYAASRLAAEMTAAQWARAHELDIVTVRAFNHTGPGQSSAFVCASLASQVAAIEARRQEPVLRAGNLDPIRDFSDVRDIAAGYVAALERGASGRVYNLCSGHGVSIAGVIAILQRHARVPFVVRSDPTLRRPADVPCLVGSAGRAAAELGWRPLVPLSDTLEALLADHRARLAT